MMTSDSRQASNDHISRPAARFAALPSVNSSTICLGKVYQTLPYVCLLRKSNRVV